MNDDFIAVLDSGIGGISVLKNLVEEFPNERFLYFGDNKNAPYGNKSIDELWGLTKKNIDLIKEYPIKCLVIGCNTLSVNLIDKIEEYAKVSTFGVFPPIKECTKGHTLLLSTVRTAKKFESNDNFHVVGFKNLANDIEKKVFCLNKLDFDYNLRDIEGYFVDKKGYYDTVILGCTHYCFIKNKIFDHFCPKKTISGNHFTVKNVKEFIENSKTSVNNNEFSVIFIGECAQYNQKFYYLSGQEC